MLTLAVASLSSVLNAQEVIPVWPNGAPGALGTEPNDIPTLTITQPVEGTANGGSVIIAPGGGYSGLAMNHEGHAIAKWFNERGFVAGVLKYRLPKNGYLHPAPMQDIQHSIQTFRANAESWKIDPDRIGIFGSSAGGHLVSTAATHILPGNPESADPIEKASSQPNFLVMLYPVISMELGMTHGGSRKNLLGPNPDEALVEDLTNDLQVSTDTPPTFIVHADDDKGVKVENSIRFYLALHKVGVPAEMHLYEKGGHGFGIRPEEKYSLPVHEWPMLLENWLVQRGLMEANKDSQ